MRIYGRVLGSLAGSVLLLTGLLAFLAQAGRAASAMLFVLPGGTGDCSQSAPCALPAALALAADGDSIYLGAGTYTGAGGAVLTVTRSVNVYGGWNGAPSGTPQRDPQTFISLLDGENSRRGVFVSGGITVTLDGVQITRGSADGLNGIPHNNEVDVGGGVYVYTSTLTINNCRIYSNTANGRGGGIYALYSRLRVTASQVQSNTAGVAVPYNFYYGGGIAIEHSPYAWLQENLIVANRGAISSAGFDDAYGGGVAFLYSDYAMVLSNTVQRNIAFLGDGVGAGGGIAFWHSGYAVVQGNSLEDNIATTGNVTRFGDGGGMLISYSPYLTVTHNTFVGNAAFSQDGAIKGVSGSGGGLGAGSPHLLLADNTFLNNVACMPCEGEGGGASLSGDDSIIRGNTFVGNIAGSALYGDGGGMIAQGSRMVLRNNLFQDNVANLQSEGRGGGVALMWLYDSIVAENIVFSNTAALSPTAYGEGGGIYLSAFRGVTLTNNVVAGNQANTRGSGIMLISGVWNRGQALFVHTTIADNHGSAGVELRPYSTIAFTNTILSGHTTGISTTVGNTVTLEATLWNNQTDWTGGGTIFTGTLNLYGDPRFIAPQAGDYHIGARSPAIDAGLDAGVTTDVDAEPRPQGAGVDLGADEHWPRLYLPLIIKS